MGPSHSAEMGNQGRQMRCLAYHHVLKTEFKAEVAYFPIHLASPQKDPAFRCPSGFLTLCTSDI